MKKSRTPKQIKDLTDHELSEAIRSLQNCFWDEKSILRVLSLKIYGDDNVMTMHMLAIPLAVELELRTTNLKTTNDKL